MHIDNKALDLLTTFALISSVAHCWRVTLHVYVHAYPLCVMHVALYMHVFNNFTSIPRLVKDSLAIFTSRASWLGGGTCTSYDSNFTIHALDMPQI